MLADIIGPDVLVVIAVIALLFGGSQLPKLARSLGTAKSEFQKGLQSADAEHAPETPGPSQASGDKPSA